MKENDDKNDEGNKSYMNNTIALKVNRVSNDSGERKYNDKLF